MKTLSVGRGNVRAVAYAPDGRTLVSLNSRSRVRFWDLRTFAERLALSTPRDPCFTGETLSLRGDLLVFKNGLWDIGAAWDWLGQTESAPAGAPSRPPPGLCRPVPLEGVNHYTAVTPTPDGKSLAG